MLAKVWSAAVRGIEGFAVRVELDLRRGLPSFQTVGLPDASVREARDRVVSAVRNSGFEFPCRRVTVNLAPAERRKGGTHLDLPIGLALLAASEQLEARDWAGEFCFLGELALDGAVRPVSGVLAMAAAAKAEGLQGIVLSRANVAEAAVTGLAAYGVDTLAEAAELLRRERRPPPESGGRQAARADGPRDGCGDLSDVRGQTLARRALEIAAAGGHNLLLVGPPGVGKSMLARRLPGILPPLEREEALEVTKIHSVAGASAGCAGLISRRPFRAPHATASITALTGGGARCKPGEFTLAHRGVLFLDEFPEFPRASLEALRQPLEDRTVTVARLRESIEFPADFMLVAAMNPCPCGYLGSRDRACRCSDPVVERYRSKLSGPLLDRIDLQVELAGLSFESWAARSGPEPENSAAVRVRVSRAREARAKRLSAGDRARPRLDKETWDLVESAARRHGLSARALERSLRVARTIADLDCKHSVGKGQMAEALQYRILDRGTAAS